MQRIQVPVNQFVICAVAFGILAYRRFGSLIRFRTVVNTSVAASLMAVLATQFMVDGPFLLVCYLGYMGAYPRVLFLVGELGREDLEMFAPGRLSSTPAGK